MQSTLQKLRFFSCYRSATSDFFLEVEMRLSLYFRTLFKIQITLKKKGISESPSGRNKTTCETRESAWFTRNFPQNLAGAVCRLQSAVVQTVVPGNFAAMLMEKDWMFVYVRWTSISSTYIRILQSMKTKLFLNTPWDFLAISHDMGIDGLAGC